MASIEEIRGRIKGLLDEGAAEWGIPTIVILVGLASFGLGRLSAFEDARSSVSVWEAPNESGPRGMHVGGLLVASRTGGSYHFPWCQGAEKILTANRIWFSNEDEAKKKGFSPAKNCKGLLEQ